MSQAEKLHNEEHHRAGADKAQRPHRNDRKIAGYCPMGCGQTLFIGDLGGITCSSLECPKPDAAFQLLCNEETTQHIVVFAEGDFSIKHPLRERLEDELFDCPLHRYLNSLPGVPVAQGKYEAVHDGAHWGFVLIG